MLSLDHLNPQQRIAVESCDQNLLIVAGAGSGKTRVLTHKICYLMENHGVHASQILAMTFSNKAAREMKNRIQTMLPQVDKPYWIGTFHATCMKLLKEFHTYIGLEPQFSIFDDADQMAVIKRVLKEMNLDPKHVPPKAIKWNISSAKNHTTDPITYLQKNMKLTNEALEVCKKYQETLLKNQALDFGDLLIKTIELLKGHPEVQELVHKRWKYVLIDEFQDTNMIQRQLIQCFKAPSTIVTAVGDEDQCIYTWRGAQVENMMEFEDHFSPAKTIKLDQNYRSTQPILDIANAVIAQNKGRRKKELWTDKKNGPMTEFFAGEDDYAEARFVIDQVEKIRHQGHSLQDCCVLYRTHAQSRVLEDEARRRNVPYRILGGTRFYDRLEIKDILSFLKCLTNPFDNIAFERIINKPTRGIGAKTVQNLRTLAAQTGTSMFQAIPKLRGSSKAHQGLGQFYLNFQKIAERLFDDKATSITESILEKTGYLKALEVENTVESDARIENIEELLRVMSDFEEQTGGDLFAFMDQVSLASDADTQDDQTSMLSFMTIHNSKGLEYPFIFIVGLEEGVFPHQRSLDDNDTEALEEERRLCYVAMTRAEKKLYLSAARRRKMYRFTMYNPVSRFIDEIPESLYQSHETSQPSASAHDWRIGRDQATDNYSQLSEIELASRSFRKQASKRAAAPLPSSPYGPGSFVQHPSFGRGVIKGCEGPQDNLKLTIQFERAGTKKILLNYVDLEVLHL